MTSRFASRCLLLALALTPPRLALADDPPPIDVTLEPWASFDGVDRPYRYILTVRPRAGGEVEVVADRRLLSFEIHPATEGRRRRALRCRHPHAPRSAPAGRVEMLRAGAGEGAAHQEWVDLRMYCWGRALEALEAGARVEGRYGFRRRSRRAWVARAPESAWRTWTAHVDLEPMTSPPIERSENTRAVGRPDAVAPIRLSMRDRSVVRASALSFPVSLRAAEGSERVYVRPDSFSFVVRGPLGAVRCALPPGGGSPAPDLYRRISGRFGVTQVLAVDAFCPEGTFELAGIYEVVPKVRLDHSGEEYGLEAVTGRFVGPTTFVRVSGGSRSYVLQVPERAEAP